MGGVLIPGAAAVHLFAMKSLMKDEKAPSYIGKCDYPGRASCKIIRAVSSHSVMERL